MLSNFITNADTKSFGERLNKLVKFGKKLDFLVGFFYFYGIRELYQNLRENDEMRLRILVGLHVDRHNHKIVEMADDDTLSQEDTISQFLISNKEAFIGNEFDNADFYEQVHFFIDLINSERLVIRKTLYPNHAKLYLFELQGSQIASCRFITGSSNLTRAGLFTQDEFNVEIGDYGFTEAQDYFEELWGKAIKVTESPETRQKLIRTIKEDTIIKEITPFEAYCLVLKSYLESFEQVAVKKSIEQIMSAKGYQIYRYQLDAISQAVATIEKYNGVILADVVGLGKTVIACAVAKQLGKRGVIICPPTLIDKSKKSGWNKYVEDFKIPNWEIYSLGDLNKAQQFVNESDDIEVVIIDEAHRFRNQDTQSYNQLKNICRNRKVILLTATPFNNRPSDLLALLQLFIPIKKSPISFDDNLKTMFTSFQKIIEQLAYIKKNCNSPNQDKADKARTYYRALFGDAMINLRQVETRGKYLANRIKAIIQPVTIRRNRLDLQDDARYEGEVGALSRVANPKEWFFELTSQQSIFYDKVLQRYFCDTEKGSIFKGAIYRPFEYEQGILGEKAYNKAKNRIRNTSEDGVAGRQITQQRNLFDFMRRLLVKRFESSFGSFSQSIDNFLRINGVVKSFVEKTGEYILDRGLLEKIWDSDPEEIEAYLEQYEKDISRNKYPKNHKRYRLDEFANGECFKADIQSDIEMFKEIKAHLDNLKITGEADPKTACLLKNIAEQLSAEPDRKIVIFTEYVDTAKYLEPSLRNLLGERLLFMTGRLSQRDISFLNENFDASFKKQKDDFDVLLTTDKLSEGFNLNRAGMIINYDIPWNPVRVIQRLGRINRISKKVFDELYIVNFFPTERGAQIVQAREIAANKMFLIHNALGEDAKIFDIDEQLEPSKLYSKIQQNPDELEEASLYTRIYRDFEQIRKEYPEVIEGLENCPPRVKVAKAHREDELLVIYKKNNLHIVAIGAGKDNQPQMLAFEDVLAKVACPPEEKRLPLSASFWECYSKAVEFSGVATYSANEQSLEQKAFNNIMTFLQFTKPCLVPLTGFLRTLREDIVNYGTLPDYTLRVISEWDAQDLNKATRAIKELREFLGEDYLEKEKLRLRKTKKEIIIAIENIGITPAPSFYSHNGIGTD